MPTVTVKVTHTFDPDAEWRCTDYKGEHNEEFYPPDWVKMAVGARREAYFRAQWSIDGWRFMRHLVHPPASVRDKFLDIPA